MAKIIPVPKFGQSEETVTIVRWHKAEGDAIRKGDVLFEVETDKSVLEVESQFDGTLLKIAAQAGQEVPVMSPAAVVGAPGDEIPPLETPKRTKPKPAASPTAAPAAKEKGPEPRRQAAPTVPTPAPAAPVPAAPGPAASAPSRRPVSPRARKFAADYLIRLEDVPGTGPGGRVVERDVKSYLDESGYHERKLTPTARSLARRFGFSVFDLQPTGTTGRITAADVRRAEAERPKAMTKLRQTIARRLQQSKQTIPHFYVTVAADMTALMAYRKELKQAGYTVTINDFIVKAVALALTEFPALNSSTSDGVHLTWHSDVNVGVAVSVDAGLLVPVLRNADRMPLDEIHDATVELADKARQGKLTPAEMEGGTFTVTNMGMLNIENFGAIINPGESAILAIASARPTALATEDRSIVVHDMMRMTLSADHRVVDGTLGAVFANEVKRKLEDVGLWRAEVGPLPDA